MPVSFEEHQSLYSHKTLSLQDNSVIWLLEKFCPAQDTDIHLHTHSQFTVRNWMPLTSLHRLTSLMVLMKIFVRDQLLK